jgi:hypothetical protein
MCEYGACLTILPVRVRLLRTWCRAGRGDHLGEQGEVRAGQEDGAHQGGPDPLLVPHPVTSTRDR